MLDDPQTPFDVALATQGVDFQYPDESGDAPGATPRQDLQSAILEFLRQLTGDSTALLAGQRLHLLAYLAGVSDCRTQRELADRLNVSPGRVTQILQALPSELQGMAQLKRRTAKRRAFGEI